MTDGVNMKSQRIGLGSRVTQATALMAMLTGGLAYADDKQFVYSAAVKGKVKVPEWIRINNIYGAWVNTGSPFGCGVWDPDVTTQDYGNTFQQSRICQQAQQREVTPVLFNPILRTTKNGDTEIENRAINISQYQPNVGERDFIASETADSWGQWVDVGAYYNCGNWTPEPDSVDLYVNFDQTRNCSQNQERTRQVYDVWASGRKTPKRIDTDAQTVTEVDQRVETGVRDFIDGQRIDAWGAWVDNGGHYECGVWSPDPTTVNLFEDFTQARTCSQDQEAERDVFDVWASGKETLNRVEKRAQTIDEGETRSAVGSRDYINGSRADDWSSWVDSGEHHTCGAWAAAPSSQTSDYTQTRDCQQPQESTRRVYDTWASDKETLNRIEKKEQNITEQESRPVAVNYTSWVDKSTPFACTDWTPDVSEIPYGDSYTQNRDCSQTQVRSRIYTAEGKTLRSVEESQVITVGQTQSNVGQEDFITGETDPAWSVWTDSTGLYDCGVWSPAPANQTTNFSQSQSCSKDQERERTIENVWASGKKTFKRVEEDSQTVPASRNRTVTVSWSNWTTVKGDYDCTVWSPDLATVNIGEKVTQKRACLQDEERARTYSAGGSEINSFTEDRTVTKSYTKSGDGEKDHIISQRFTAYTAWSEVDGSRSCNGWSPAPSAQSSDYTQTRGCGFTEERSRDVYNVWASGKETFVETQTPTRLSNDTESRTVEVNYSSWVNAGNTTSCSAWSPSTGTVPLGQSFTQTRNCTQPQERTRIYVAGGSTLNTAKETRGVPVVESRSSTGTDDFVTGTERVDQSWVNSGSIYACSSWSPAAGSQTSNFTQSRTCDQNQTKAYTVYNVWKSGERTVKNTGSDTQTIKVNDSRSVAVSRTGWVDSGNQYNCSVWSPSTDTVDWGDSFAQSQSCRQNQTRNRVYKVGTTTINSVSESRTIVETNNRSAVGTRDFVTGSTNKNFSAWSNEGGQHTCSAWTPEPSSQTSAFNQARTCKQNQERTYDVYNVMASGEHVYNRTVTQGRVVEIDSARSVTVSWSGWSNSGSVTSCSTWLPNATTVNLGQSFTQTRSCTQPQTRSRIYKVGTSTIHSVGESRGVSVTQSRNDVGEKDYITGTRRQNTTGWHNDGGIYNCGGWSPTPGTQTSNYSQSRACKQNQDLDYTIYNVWKSGTETVKSTGVDERVLNVTDSRSVAVSVSGWSSVRNHTFTSWTPEPGSRSASYTQSRTYKTDQTRTWTHKVGSTIIHTRAEPRVIDRSQSRTNTMEGIKYGAWSAFSNTGGKSCGSWGPAPTTQTSNFTQTRSCTQGQKRTRNTYYTWRYSPDTFRSTESDTRNVSTTESRTVSVSVSGWSAVRNHSYSGWSPEPWAGRSTSYSQRNDYKQDQTRTWYYKVGSTTIGTRPENQTVNKTSWRTNTMQGIKYNAWSSWSNSGSKECGGWSPAPTTQTSNFTQTRSCTQGQKRTRNTYYTWQYSGDTFRRTDTETRSVPSTESRTVVVSYSSWRNSGGVYNCGGWSPSTSTVNGGQSFTQTGSCSQNQTRTRSYSVGGSAGESRVISVSQTRAATGTKDYITGPAHRSSTTPWANSGPVENCTAWNPKPSDVNYGTQYSASRYCDQPQTRDITYYDMWWSGKETVRRVERNDPRTLRVRQDSTLTGTKNYSTGQESDYSAWSGWSYHRALSSYSPTKYEVAYGLTFTQTRSIEEKSTRTKKVYTNYANGTRTLVSSTTETRYRTSTQSREAVGLDEDQECIFNCSDPNAPVTFARADEVTEQDKRVFAYKEENTSCSDWSPSEDTIEKGKSFTQTRSCEVVTQNFDNIVDVYVSGRIVVKQEGVAGSRSEDTITQTRQVLGQGCEKGFAMCN
jgi:hypothetical protein